MGSLSPSHQSFEDRNRAVLEDPRALRDADLLLWKEGRDALARRALQRQGGSTRRRSPRAEAILPGFLAGHGGVFTVDLGFEGISLRVSGEHRPGRSEVASVRLRVGEHSVYLSGRVAWLQDDRLGIHVEQVHPADEQLLHAAVCRQLLEILRAEAPTGPLLGRRAGD
ncbi:MAG TPA: PilZ domain-containing protein [Anaeromyxobacteraceae bacterium]|nr:PilZ domain-containing protein [Anaeromyxobacteraceae bacterium]